jgi:hypothetical protein
MGLLRRGELSLNRSLKVKGFFKTSCTPASSTNKFFLTLIIYTSHPNQQMESIADAEKYYIEHQPVVDSP